MPAAAQDLLRIAAIVNDDLISVFDLHHRARFILVSTNTPENQDTMRRVGPTALRQLIDERLMIQEAKRLNINVSDNEIEAQIRQTEDQARLGRGGLDEYLKRAGLPRSTLVNQYRAVLSWQRVVQRRIRPQVQIGQDEVDELLQRSSQTTGGPEFLLAEIFVPVDTPEQEDEARQTVNQVMERLKAGTPFPQVALQYSQAASARQGGDIGWVGSGQLEQEIEAVLTRAPRNSVTEPIRTAAGFYIYGIRDKRTPGGPATPPPTLSSALKLMQLVISNRQASERGASGEPAILTRLRERAKQCSELSAAAREFGLSAPAMLPDMRLGEIAPQIRGMLAELQPGEISRPIAAGPQGIAVVMLCSRSDPQQQAEAPPPPPPPSRANQREEVENNLLRQRIELASRRYLRDLRRVAFIDVRV